MKFKVIVPVILLSLIFLAAAPNASETRKENKPLTKKQLHVIRKSKDPKLMAGAAMIGYKSLNSDRRRRLLESASQMESPKGLATLSLIDFEIGKADDDSPVSPLVQKSILNLLRDDRDNALPYYLNALAQKETAGDDEALSQIIQGNTKTLNDYTKQRFNAVVEAAETAKLSRIEARDCAFSSFLITHVYGKLRRLCRKLIKSKGQTARDACFEMGEKLERGSLALVDQMLSMGIQNEALSEQCPYSPQRMAIDKRSDRIYKILYRSKGVKEECIPEDGLSRFFMLLAYSLDEESEKEYDLPDDVKLHCYNLLLNEGEYAALEYQNKYTEQSQNKK